jgi:hypothetical protein
VNPFIVAVPTVIVHVTLETTSPEAALASFGCVGDGDGDGLLPDGAALTGADALAVPVAPAVGVGAVGVAEPEGADADADGEGVADEVVDDGLGAGLGLLGDGRQIMPRMQA